MSCLCDQVNSRLYDCMNEHRTHPNIKGTMYDRNSVFNGQVSIKKENENFFKKTLLSIQGRIIMKCRIIKTSKFFRGEHNVLIFNEGQGPS